MSCCPSDDDGGGMDPVLQAPEGPSGERSHGKPRLAESARRIPEAFNLIFALVGFQPRLKSPMSGRGVGMDVVRTKITQLNGTLSIDLSWARF